MSKFNNLCKHISDGIVKNSPEILMGIGIIGMGTAIIFAVKSTPKAVILLEEKKKNMEVDKLEIGDIVKTAWKCYIPSAALFASSTACIIFSNKVSSGRCAALATAYKLSETALADYQEKVIETIGEKKEEAIRDKVAKSKIEKNPVKNNEIIITGRGDVKCYEIVSGRYFYSDIDKIKKIVNELNRKLINENYISLNEFYYELGLRPTDVGDNLGWNVDDGLIDIHFSSHLDDDDTPCLVLDYHISPRYNYMDLH